MKKVLTVNLILIFSVFAFFCTKPAPAQITPEIFIGIQNELLSSDQSDAAKETAAKKFGFTAKDYDEFDKKIESNPDLKAKVGEIRLKQSDKKK
jgi:hypothetical protein